MHPRTWIIGKNIGKRQAAVGNDCSLTYFPLVHNSARRSAKSSAKMLTKTAIEPVIPIQKLRPLEDLACTIVERAARLSARLREPLRVQVAELTRWMHCYYSNLIEGQQTRVRDIEAALKKDFAADPTKLGLQQLSLAHVEVQRWAASATPSPYTADNIR
jgi:hypothetical protein